MLFAFAVCLAAQIEDLRRDDAAALRTITANGAVIWCENRTSPYTTVQLFIGNKGMQDTQRTYGYRHLLEHVIARSVPGIDRMIETKGGFLFASTSRDFIKFEIRVAKNDVSLALDTIRKMLVTPEIGDDAVTREVSAIKHELRLVTKVDIASVNAWKSVYGDDGLDAAGSFESLSKVTAAELRTYWRKLAQAQNIVIAVSGEIDRKKYTFEVTKILQDLPFTNAKAWEPRKVIGQYVRSSEAAIPTKMLGSSQHGASLIAAFAVAARVPKSFVTLTPSLRDGLILIGTTDANEDLKEPLYRSATGEDYRIGQNFAMNWLESKSKIAADSADFNATLLLLDPSMSIQKVKSSVQSASFEDFRFQWNLLRNQVVK
jgi:hypothetical protein